MPKNKLKINFRANPFGCLNLDNSAYSKEILTKLTKNNIEIVEIKEENIGKAIEESQLKINVSSSYS